MQVKFLAMVHSCRSL